METIRSHFAGIHKMIYILAALVILVVLDGVITNLLLKYGIAREGNPFLQNLVGGNIFITVKVFGAFISAFILWDIHKSWPRVAVVSGLCFAAVYTGIVLWNLQLLLFHQV